MGGSPFYEVISQKFNLMNDGFPSDFLAVIVFLESAPLEIITTMTQVKTLPIRVITSGPEPHRPTKAQTPVCVIWGKIEYSVAVSEAYFVQCGKGGKAGKSGWSRATNPFYLGPAAGQTPEEVCYGVRTPVRLFLYYFDRTDPI